jgi:hypothetical protein
MTTINVADLIKEFVIKTVIGFESGLFKMRKKLYVENKIDIQSDDVKNILKIFSVNYYTAKRDKQQKHFVLRTDYNEAYRNLTDFANKNKVKDMYYVEEFKKNARYTQSFLYMSFEYCI